MRSTVVSAQNGHAVARASLAAAIGLAVLAALVLTAPWVADLTDLPTLAHDRQLNGLGGIVGLGIVVATVNGALGTGLRVSLATVVVPMLVVAIGMIAIPGLGLSTPDTSAIGGLLLVAYFFGLAVVFGLGGFAIGRVGRWLVTRLAR